VIYSSVDMYTSVERLKSETSSSFQMSEPIILTFTRQRVYRTRKNPDISKLIVYFILIIFRYICDYLILTESTPDETPIFETVSKKDSSPYEKKNSVS
jgi:hypothetical protein